jgi:hypothetical protein
MNDDTGELPSFGLGGPIDASRAQKQIEQDIERRTVRHMLAQALSNWRKTKRGRPKAQWRENLLPAIARTMDSHPDVTDTERALIISEKMWPKIRTVQNWLPTVRKARKRWALAAALRANCGNPESRIIPTKRTKGVVILTLADSR